MKGIGNFILGGQTAKGWLPSPNTCWNQCDIQRPGCSVGSAHFASLQPAHLIVSVNSRIIQSKGSPLFLALNHGASACMCMTYNSTVLKGDPHTKFFLQNSLLSPELQPHLPLLLHQPGHCSLLQISPFHHSAECAA